MPPDTLVLSFPDCVDQIRIVREHKHLGVVIDNTLSWNGNTTHICDRTSRAIGIVAAHCSHLPPACRSLFYRAYILLLFDYACISWCGLSNSLSQKLEIQHKSLLKIIFRKDKLFPSALLYTLCSTVPLASRRKFLASLHVHKIRLNKLPNHPARYNWFVAGRSTRNCLTLPTARSNLTTQSPYFIAYSAWLSLSSAARLAPSIPAFKSLYAVAPSV